MEMRKISIAEVEGFRLGNAESITQGTGVTAIIADKGAVGGVDVRGGGPATRETDLLKSENTVDKINAIVLSGGSAFGLEAASGVMRALSAKGIGLEVLGTRVPIVCGASLFDLGVADSKAFPDVKMGQEAVANAYKGGFLPGNHGAGTGATVGKLKGMERAMKTGLGTFACSDGYVQVGAVVAVNAAGDVYNGAGNIIAGLRSEDGRSIYGSIRSLKSMVHDRSDAETEDKSRQKKPAENRTAPAAEKRAFAPVKKNRTMSERTTEMARIAEAIKQEFTRANTISREELEQRIEETRAELKRAEDEYLLIDEVPVASGRRSHMSVEDPSMAAQPEETAVPETFFEAAAKHAAGPVEKHAAGPAVEASPAFVPEAAAEAYAPAGVPAQTTEAYAAPAAPASSDATAAAPLSDEDLGYDIPFNTTIGCLITNAELTKSQANKLASILHDAYARAIKPVHSTLDGDTIFVLSTCRQKVNFDAFAALATDVMQYAIIDGANAAKSAYGLPAARDMHNRE